MIYDTIVVGLGAAGAAALYELALRGKRVLGIDRFAAPNDRASHHGHNRIIRMAYAEDASYVPLLRRAYEGWRSLEARSGDPILFVTGSVHGGYADSEEFSGALKASREHDIDHEVVDGTELNRRYPGFSVPAEFRFVVQPQGGFVTAENAIRAYLSIATGHGAEVHEHEPVRSFVATSGAVEIVTDSATYSSGSVIFAAGAWMGKLVPELAPHLEVRRQVVGWFRTSGDAYKPGRFPTFLLEGEGGPMFGFPEFGAPGFKIGRHHHLREVADPDNVDRHVSEADEAVMRNVIERYFPLANGPMISSSVGLYTNTRDEYFVLDQLSGHPQVVIASPCSGHGFKFSPVLGEILADLATDGQTRWNIDRHRLHRLQAR